MNDVYSTRKFDQRTISDADQAEFIALLHGSATVDAGVYDDKIAGALDDFEPFPAVDLNWHRQDLELDLAVGRIQEEIERRVRLIGGGYPFSVDSNKLIYTESQTHFYEFCLATSCAETITKGKFVELPRVFERITAAIVGGYLGEHSEVLHTGWPRDKNVGRKFKAAMKFLNERSGEWIWNPEPDLPDDPPKDKDGGLDFVAWKKSPDGRAGQLFIAAQCACGDDWSAKFHDLSFGRLSKWFHPMSYVQPVRAFATPFLLSDGNLLDAQREAGLIFDRTRLAIVAARLAENVGIQGWRPQLQELSKLVFTTSAIISPN
jgi:hypothetical protein